MTNTLVDVQTNIVSGGTIAIRTDPMIFSVEKSFENVKHV